MLKKKTIILIVSSLLLFSQASFGQEKNLEWYYNEARKSISAENFEYAIRILTEAKKKYPDSARIVLELADLYYHKKFYERALNEYLVADEIDPNDYYTLNHIQQCYGLLNQEDMAIKYLKTMIEEYPLEEYSSTVDAIDDLGWMYFKTHKLKEGEKLILDTLAQLEPGSADRGLLMTLGTIYSGMFNYNKSKEYYMKSIMEAEEYRDTYFASIAYYNLSLLEHNFYNYNSSFDYTDKALKNEERATGHLSKGELYQTRMDFDLALAEFQKGYAKDDTPLIKVDMAILYRLFGSLDLSLRYAEEVLNSKDASWMAYFGTNVLTHRKELHDLMARIYDGLARRQSVIPQKGILESADSLLKSAWYSLNAYYHRQKFTHYSILVGKEYMEEQNYLNAYWQFYRANEAYEQVALKYLNLAREYEEKYAAHAKAYYLQEEGKIRHSKDLLMESIKEFDPFWEKEGIFNSLLYMAPLIPDNTLEKRNVLNRIYGINPGGLLQNGLALPMIIKYNLSRDRQAAKGIITGFLRNTGSDILEKAAADSLDAGFRYELTIEWLSDDKAPRFSLKDSSTNLMVKSDILTASEEGGDLYVQCVLYTQDLLLNHLYSVD
ncbi:MAG: hypothetical protein JW969_21545 [Spirochaetales bacterium]|nr:hypothetical protein [Spirochaetales bacterium]